MTREEAYNRIDSIIAKNEIDDEYVTITNPKDYDALRIARKTLEQEPCEDCISREAVLSLKTPVDTMTGWSGYMIDALDVEQLPSIQPKPKTDVLDKIKEEIKDNTYFINETTEKEGIDFETVEKIIDKYTAESEE